MFILNLKIHQRAQNNNISQAVLFKNGSLNLIAENSSLILWNIQLKFETTVLNGLGFINLDNGFIFQMIVSYFFIILFEN